MKLYYSAGACSLADHIALHEADIAFERVKVDLKTKRTEDGADFTTINPKGYVPTLEFDDGERLTENVAILSWVAHRTPALVPPGEHGALRLLEMLAFISTEIHKQFSGLFRPVSDAQKTAAEEKIGQRFTWLANNLKGDYLFGSAATVADSYLFVMLLWAQKVGLTLPAPLTAYFARMKARPAVQKSLQHEGL